MKKTFLLLLPMTMLMSADLSVKQIEEMVVKIHEKRAGADLATLESTKDPFIRLEEEEIVTTSLSAKKAEEKMILHAIVNGRAYINDSWKNIDDVILGYTLKHIGKRGVVLRNGNHIKKLFLHKKRDNLITLEERL